ncbi:1,2-phenylacetyl-CoA epoxidase subunit PaaE [Halosimplex aquaticum]|uniref:1,2-phenylacetyl-CoA epoxidase subunit PaaE n=1 Tax=Halosimplex aquaticum TaxID=3026162 RepID=A0ABD5YA31_9EURY|nr:1,2-phenylacetyl-CoA epoxidase subunit PaaE [Halosimplex aquaticum]
MGRRADPSVEAGGEDAAVACPYCGSTETERDHPKGPSLCRSMHYCTACDQPFEAMRD